MSRSWAGKAGGHPGASGTFTAHVHGGERGEETLGTKRKRKARRGTGDGDKKRERVKRVVGAKHKNSLDRGNKPGVINGCG